MDPEKAYDSEIKEDEIYAKAQEINASLTAIDHKLFNTDRFCEHLMVCKGLVNMFFLYLPPGSNRLY